MVIDVFVFILTVLAFTSSAYFIFTWGWAIWKAKRHGEHQVTWFGVVDYAGLQALVFAYTGLAFYSFVTVGIPPITSWDALVRRILLYILIVLVAGIRTSRWVLRQNPRWARPFIRLYDRHYHRRAIRRMSRAGRR